MSENTTNQNPEEDLGKPENLEGLIKEMKSLVAAAPLTQDFIGSVVYEKGGIFSKKNSSLDISSLRKQVLLGTTTVGLKLRQEIEANLKKYPAHGEMHALHAIQVFKDTSQGGVSSQKLQIIKGAVKELAIAIYHGADSVAILIHFMNIYIAYLSMLLDRTHRIVKQSYSIQNSEVAGLRKTLLTMTQQLGFLQMVKSKVGGLQKLASTLGNTNYTLEPINVDELREASRMLLQGQESQPIKGSNKKGSHLLYITFAKIQLFAQVPILRSSLIKSLKSVPEVHRDLVLQKRMVILVDGINEFKHAVYNGKAAEALDGAKKLLQFIQQTITDYLEAATLTKSFEADPFLRYAWVVLECKELFSADEFQGLLRQAMKYLQVITSTRCLLKNATEQAQNYIFDINSLQDGV